MTLIGHSKFFAGRRKVNAKDLGAIPGRVIPTDELYSFTRTSAINQQRFGDELVEQLDTETPVFVELDSLTTARLWFLESLSQEEAAWAGPGTKARQFNEMALPPHVLALLIADFIRIEVRKAFARKRRNGRQDFQRVLVWEDATRARLEAYFQLEYFGYPAQDWNSILKDGLARLGLAGGSTSDRNVVSFKYRGIKNRIIQRIRRDCAQSIAAEALESVAILGRRPAAGMQGEAGQLGSQDTGLIGMRLMILLEPVQLIGRRGSRQRLGQSFFHGGGGFQQRSA
jgi:hypothetical protein